LPRGCGGRACQRHCPGSRLGRAMGSACRGVVQSAQCCRCENRSMHIIDIISAIHLVDIIVVSAVAIFAIMGIRRGVLREVVTMIVWVLGLLAAWHLGHYLEPQLRWLLTAAVLRIWSARAIIFLIMLFVGWAVAKALLHHVHVNMEKGVDRALGLTFGAIRGVVVVGVLVLLGQQLSLDRHLWWRHSTLMPYGESVANGVRSLVGEEGHRRPTA
jgi:membrane protein required for colicin V production